jgi:hypothetical protein
MLIRSATECVWAVHQGVSDDVAARIAVLASQEVPTGNLRAPPLHAAEYLSLTRGRVGFCGPAFAFPENLPDPGDVVQVESESLLQRHFRGWVPGEIAAGRAPVLAVVEDGHPVSVCFSARTSDVAAAAGLETAERFRGRGLAGRVVAAWGHTIRAGGRLPMYSASWDNAASLAVTRKLGMTAFASYWSAAD